MNGNAKGILFKVEMKGKGIVNYDSDIQKNALYAVDNPYPKEILKNKNFKVSKKHFYKNDEGTLEYKMKISSGCLRHEIFKKYIPFINNSISEDRDLLMKFIGSVPALLRGYCFASEGIKRSSPTFITSATVTNGAVPYPEICTTTGERDSNSMTAKEDAGLTEYEFKGAIDFDSLQFMPMDTTFDRLNLNSDDYLLFKNYIENFEDCKLQNLPENMDGQYYVKTKSIIGLGETGILFDKSHIIDMVNFFFSLLSELYIERSAGNYAGVTSIKYLIVENHMNNFDTEKEEWIDYDENTPITFNPEIVYEKSNCKEKHVEIKKIAESKNKKNKVEDSDTDNNESEE